MSHSKSLIWIAAIASLFLLNSCIDGREELWIEANGSGRAEIHYSLPAAAARLHGGESGIRDLIEGFLQKTPEIQSSSCDVISDGERLHVAIKTSFRSALDLQQLAEGESIKTLPNAATHLAGKVKTSFHGRTMDFARTITPSKALPGAAFLPLSGFQGHRLTYIIHLPAVPNNSNATRTENGGRTLVWDMPLETAIQSPIVTRFQIDIPIPWKLLLSIAVPVLVGGILLIRNLRRRRRARFAESST
jgi:hypothetical protein